MTVTKLSARDTMVRPVPALQDVTVFVQVTNNYKV